MHPDLLTHKMVKSGAMALQIINDVESAKFTGSLKSACGRDIEAMCMDKVRFTQVIIRIR